jgi:hypothetical protein
MDEAQDQLEEEQKQFSELQAKYKEEQQKVRELGTLLLLLFLVMQFHN